MKRIASILLAAMLVSGCSDASSIGIIGGADGPTAVFIAGKGQLPPSSQSEPVPESPPAESTSQSESAASQSTSTAPPASSSSTAPPPASSSKAAESSTGRFVLSSETVKAGDMITLTCKDVEDPSTLKVTATVAGERKFFANGADAVALVAVGRAIEPGKYQLTVTENGKVAAEIPFTVADPKFEKQSFEMDQSTVNSTVNNTEARDEYNRITASVMDVSTADAQFPALDDFVMPLNLSSYRISSSFGFTRIVNGKVSGRHEGVDFPAAAGTPVVAAGAGRVLYSGLMQMTGNTVIIEHGMGLKTWYHHMSALDCETGDLLQAGDPVGKVGTTGYSTGNHLHFGVSVFNTYANPMQFIPYPG